MRLSAAAAALACCTSYAADIQAERAQFIASLRPLGVIQKVDKPAQFCHAYTGPKFDALPLDQKSEFVNVVYAWCVTSDPRANIVVIRDGRSGKDIGTYAAVNPGLRLK